VLHSLAAAIAVFGEEAVLAFTRVLGSSLARIAEAGDAMFVRQVEGPMRAGGSTDAQVARTAREAVEVFLGVPTVMADLWRRHAAAALERSRAARGEGVFDRFHLAVGFADLVGFTALAARLDNAELGAAVADFEREAADRATAGGARLVKSMGDAAMIVGADTVAVAGVVADLVEFVHDHPVLTELRAALAVGDLVAREGDYYGPEVNLAARAVKEADPGELVTTADAAAALEAAGWAVEALGPRPLRGFDEPIVLHRARRAVGPSLRPEG
jgi:adenylate cyclase